MRLLRDHVRGDASRSVSARDQDGKIDEETAPILMSGMQNLVATLAEVDGRNGDFQDMSRCFRLSLSSKIIAGATVCPKESIPGGVASSGMLIVTEK
jgi:hypothetical protein